MGEQESDEVKAAGEAEKRSSKSTGELHLH
jgi:hypothetical protein